MIHFWGNKKRINHECRTKPAEILFNPSAGEDKLKNAALDGGIASMTAKCVDMCDKDLQPDLYKNIVLSGGSIMFPGFAERFKRDLYTQLKPGTHYKVTPDPSNPEPGSNWQRKHSAWIGGSMFASLDTFPKVQITKQEWEDSHENIIHRKCI